MGDSVVGVQEDDERCTLHFLSATHTTLHGNGTWEHWHLLRPISQPEGYFARLHFCACYPPSNPTDKVKKQPCQGQNLCLPSSTARKWQELFRSLQLIVSHVRNENYYKNIKSCVLGWITWNCWHLTVFDKWKWQFV